MLLTIIIVEELLKLLEVSRFYSSREGFNGQVDTGEIGGHGKSHYI